MLQTQRAGPRVKCLKLISPKPSSAVTGKSLYPVLVNMCCKCLWTYMVRYHPEPLGEGGSAKLHAQHPASHFSLQLISPFSDLKHRIHWNSGCFRNVFLALHFLFPGTVIKPRKKDLKRNLRTQHLKICLYSHFLRKKEMEEYSIQYRPFFVCLCDPHKDLRQETDGNSSKPFFQKHFTYQVCMKDFLAKKALFILS